ncbi:unnamed protein product [Lymnaea stagnalis]|uniref:DUF4550 domain-containing protein n=1 Tax=Lymnaea stagnalis TaxID=6523 RepID=A0AAV2I8G4_LYMST
MEANENASETETASEQNSELAQGSLSEEGALDETKSTTKLLSPSPLPKEGYDVTFTVAIAMAVPTVYEEFEGQVLPSADQNDESNQKGLIQKRTIDSPRAQNYYHLEYYLLPDDVEPMKIDVVTYGVAVKVFMEKQDAKVIKTWQDGDITWFAWAHSHTVTVTKEKLMSMFKHTVLLKIWDSKEKCSTRARFDRPKAFRLPQAKPGEKPEDIGGVKALVVKQMKHYLLQQPKKGHPVRSLPTKVSAQNLAYIKMHGGVNKLDRPERETLSANTKVLVAVPNKDGQEGRGFDHLSQLAGPDIPSPKSTPSGKKPAANKKDNKGKVLQKVISKDDREKKTEAEQAKALAEHIKKHGICNIPLRLALLFGDSKLVTSRLHTPTAGIEDMFLGVSLNIPLLSTELNQELNPMMIRVDYASCLPNTPISYDKLEQRCHPVYCKYKFFTQPEYVTPGKQHAQNIYWEDTNVVLLGMLEQSHLLEFLNGPPMEIEVHDRDRKPETVSIRPALFGDDLEDEKISNVGTVESRRTLYNPFHGRDKPWDPYGVAKVNLSELLLGHKFLHLRVPITNCAIPDILGADQDYSGKLIGLAGAVDGPVDGPLPAGHYLENSSMLKVKIELAQPIISPANVVAKEIIPTSRECPFNRIIFMFDYENLEMLHNVQTLVMSFNAKALDLDSMPQHVIDAALSTYKLSVVQQDSLDLDIITGFHVLDGERHIFVLEGLKDGAITTLWEALPQQEDSDIQVLYNSNLSFSRRMYGALDVDLCRVKLHEPLRLIVEQPLLYVRDMVFRPCFDALIKLDQMKKVAKMTDVVRNNLFPTVEMVVTMSREFGVPFTQMDLDELNPAEEEDRVMEEQSPGFMQYTDEPRRQWKSIDNFNERYIEQLNTGRKRQNFVAANIMDVHSKSAARHAENLKTKKPHISVDVDPAYNYSIQKLNTTEYAKEKLRQYLREIDPNARYAYNQEFLSGMFCPVNLEQEKKDLNAADHAMWRTDAGWIFPGMKSVEESNKHPHRPNSARIDELKRDWVENSLHANIFKSPVGREHYPWVRRHEDLNLFSRPPPNFGNEITRSINLPWLQEFEEKKALQAKQQEEWQSRVVVDDNRQYFHRLLPETEMRMQGFYSSNQLDRLKGLLKDPVRRKALQFSGPVNSIPPLAVVNNPLVDTVAREQGVHLYPAIPDDVHPKFTGYNPGNDFRQLNHPNNFIPCYDYEHEKFKTLKGQDFNIYHKTRSKFSKRPIFSLLPEERDNHLFRSGVFSPYYQPLPPLGQRSLTEPAMSGHFQIEPTNMSASNDTEGDTTSGLHENNESLEATSLEVQPPTLTDGIPQQITLLA